MRGPVVAFKVPALCEPPRAVVASMIFLPKMYSLNVARQVTLLSEQLRTISAPERLGPFMHGCGVNIQVASTIKRFFANDTGKACGTLFFFWFSCLPRAGTFFHGAQDRRCMGDGLPRAPATAGEGTVSNKTDSGVSTNFFLEGLFCA